jgi:type IV fimbrial biogenesis protein FimT
MSKSPQSGFTIVELLVVMGIMALVMNFALPNVMQMMANFKSSATVNTLISDLNFAKSASISSGKPVLVQCVGTFCTNTPSDWSGGWRICYDVSLTNSNTCNIGGLTTLPNPIRRAGALGSGQKVTNSVGANLYFYPTGYANAAPTFTATAAKSTGQVFSTRAIAVTASGSISTIDRR